MEALTSTVISSYPSTSLKFQSFPISLSSVRPQISTNYSKTSLKSLFNPLQILSTTYPRKTQLKCSTVLGEVGVEEEVKTEETEKTPQKSNQRRKLFVLNLPWSLSVVDIKNLFGECGGVDDVEIIKNEEGRSKGFAFVTMASGEEAQAAIDKFNSFEVSGRIIRVDFARRFKKPPGVPPPKGPKPPSGETRHKLYVSNLAWKVRSTNLRECFSENHNPVSARVVFDSAAGKAAGYGFVSFDTREEAEAAISALDGKELLGRPIRVKFSESDDKSENKEVAVTEEVSEVP